MITTLNSDLNMAHHSKDLTYFGTYSTTWHKAKLSNVPTQCSVLLVGEEKDVFLAWVVRLMSIAFFKRPYFVLQMADIWTEEMVTYKFHRYAEKTYLITTNPTSRVLGLR